MVQEFSIQLYSLKDETAKDFEGTLRKVAEIGYHGVEFAGYGNLSSFEMKALLDELNMKSVGSHVGIERLRDHFKEEMDYNKVIGTKFIVIPGYQIKSDDDVAKFIAEIKELAPRVKAEGFQLGYHNHAHEFEKGKDGYFLDAMFAPFAPDELIMELDIYWAAYAGIDYIDYMKQHGDHVKLLHLKQMADFESKRAVDLDEGIIDFGEIATLGNQIGVEQYILEQEEFDKSPWESVSKGFHHIMNL